MIRSIVRLLWGGLWTGFGVEGSFFFLWLIWRFTHSKVVHKIEATHWFHILSEYFK